MSKKYFVHTRAQSNGDHEVHDQSCYFLPEPEYRIYVGTFSDCQAAAASARRQYVQVDGCKFCASDCHHS